MTAETVGHFSTVRAHFVDAFPHHKKVKLSTTILTYFGYALLVAFGYLRDFMSK